MATQLNMQLDVAGQPYPVPPAVATAITAVGREAVTNLNKHARVGPHTVTLLFEPDTVVLELVNAVTPAGRDGLSDTGAGVGLRGMRTRMAEVGGLLTAGPSGARWSLRAEWRRA